MDRNIASFMLLANQNQLKPSLPTNQDKLIQTKKIQTNRKDQS